VSNWLYNKENAILEEEVAYANHGSDLFPLVPRPKSSLRRLLECSQRFRFSRFWRTQPSDLEEGPWTDDGYVHYSSDEKVDRFVGAIILLLGVMMLIAPLWILKFVPSTLNRLGVISTFIVLFVVLLSFTTVAKPFESLAAAAGYVSHKRLLSLHQPQLMSWPCGVRKC
jgi:hypothetical protein